jgi:hypothetical protein
MAEPNGKLEWMRTSQGWEVEWIPPAPIPVPDSTQPLEEQFEKAKKQACLLLSAVIDNDKADAVYRAWREIVASDGPAPAVDAQVEIRALKEDHARVCGVYESEIARLTKQLTREVRDVIALRAGLDDARLRISGWREPAPPSVVYLSGQALEHSTWMDQKSRQWVISDPLCLVRKDGRDVLWVRICGPNGDLHRDLVPLQTLMLNWTRVP